MYRRCYIIKQVRNRLLHDMVKQELIPILIAQNERKLDELLKLWLLFDCASKNALASFVLLENKSLSWHSHWQITKQLLPHFAL